MVRLLSELSPETYDIRVVTLTGSEPSVLPMLPEHVTVRSLDIQHPLQAYRLPSLYRRIRDTDILVCSLFHATAVGVPLATLSGGVSTVVWQHNTRFASRARRELYRAMYRLADAVLADSEAVRTMLLEEFGLPDERVSVVPIAGIDAEQFQPADVEPSEGETSVVTVGRLTEQKGYDDLLACARALGPGFQFHVIGDGPDAAELVASAPENVTFHRDVADDELVPMLNRADVYFQPSKYEGLCMTVIEAMACGLPVVASSVGGITESVVPGETGYLCPPGDVACFRERLAELSESADKRTAFGTAGRERVLDRYTAAELAERFEAAIDRPRSSKRRAGSGVER
jgi:glycosyltransferase involved in cell wall biosynthesis